MGHSDGAPASTLPLEASIDPADTLTSFSLGFDLSAVAMILVDASLRIIRANSAAHRMLAADPLVGRSVSEFSVPANAIRARMENASWLSGELTHLERRTDLVSGAGELLTADVCTDAVVLPSGRRLYLSQLRDVTAESRQLRAIAESELRYRQLAENMPNSSVLVFDHDLRLTLAVGEALAASGYSSDLAGKLMWDVFPDQGMDALEFRYRMALAGQHSDVLYTSPSNGRQFRVRTGPVTDSDGRVVAGMSVSEDITADRARQSQLEQIHQLGNLGSCWFDRRTGWTYDAALLALWGIDAAPDSEGFPIDVLLPAERTESIRAWDRVVTVGGRHTFPLAIRHGRTADLRHLQCTAEAMVDADGVLIRVVATYIDVTDAVTFRDRVAQERAAAAQERLLLLRGVGDALASSQLGSDDMMLSISNLACAAIGDGVAMRIQTPDGKCVERDVVAHPDPSVRDRITAIMAGSAPTFDPAVGIAAVVIGNGTLISPLRPESWRPEFAEIFGRRAFDGAKHFMVAPVRHNGAVLGQFAVFRSDPDSPYRFGDDDVLQLLADGIGAAIAEVRVREAAQRERETRLLELARQHHEILERLAGMETRERSLLAEMIHDEPIQRIVAGILRIDHLATGQDSATQADLDQIASQLEIAVDWLRNLIVVALSPPDLQDGLGPALASLAEGIFTGTPTVFTVVGPSRVALTVPAKEASFRILREALVNARKHANAKNVVLRLVEQAGHVELSLTDDGVGSTNLNAGSGHLGMATMRARATAEGGELRMQSTVGHGTVITLTLPTGIGEPA